MEDVHSLLTDVPPPSGMQQAGTEIKPACISVLIPVCERVGVLFSYLVIQSFIVLEMGLMYLRLALNSVCSQK